jgi:DOMON domain
MKASARWMVCLILVFGIICFMGKNVIFAGPSVSKQPGAWESDGVIMDNEYTKYQRMGQLDVFSRIEGDSVILGIRAVTKGWFAIGIDPDAAMKGADILLCYIKGDGQVELIDMYSTGTYGPHPPDTQQGGTSDVMMVSGSEQNGVMTVEFQRKLNTGDRYDKQLRLGENIMIWSIGATNNIQMRHSVRETGSLILD